MKQHRHAGVLLFTAGVLGACTPMPTVAPEKLKLQPVPHEWRVQHVALPCKGSVAQMTVDVLIPRYPYAAEQNGEEQKLLYELQVDNTGAVIGMRLLGEAGVAFRTAAERAIAKWRFHFADVDAACIVGNRFQVPVQFKMAD